MHATLLELNFLFKFSRCGNEICGFKKIFWLNVAVWLDSQGPLIDLYFFDVSLLKHCTLHIVNLTLLGISNGSVLLLI